jgi:extracellular factor (EF) 3-hydroxypalmitic acid methyl ester biosynthesis protein
MDACLSDLNDVAIWGPANRAFSKEIWDIAGHLLARGWLEQRARDKPRGYAGDYELLAAVYENRSCDDPLGRLLDRYFQQHAAPRAVRHRMAMMADWIVETVRNAQRPTTRLAIVGSAFGSDVRAAIERLSPTERERLRVTLLDIDPQALEFARRQLLPVIPDAHLATVPVNLFRLAARPQLMRPLADSDLLCCPGLFDYLDDTSAIAMLRALFNQLGDGGRLVVFQFAPHNPSRAYMEWLANWHLIYRDQAQLESLVTAAELPHGVASYGAESLGVDLYTLIARLAP